MHRQQTESGSHCAEEPALRPVAQFHYDVRVAVRNDAYGLEALTRGMECRHECSVLTVPKKPPSRRSRTLNRTCALLCSTMKMTSGLPSKTAASLLALLLGCGIHRAAPVALAAHLAVGVLSCRA